MSEHTKGQVAWQRFGKEWCLTGQHGMRPIILAVRKGALTSLVKGLLVPFDPDHPDARRLVACWNAAIGISTETLELDGIGAHEALMEVEQLGRDRDELIEALRDVLGPPDGETSEERQEDYLNKTERAADLLARLAPKQEAA